MPAFPSLNGIPAAIRGTLLDKRFRELLLWCLPALILGAVARGLIMYRFHYGIVHPDSADFLTTANQLLHRHRFVLHGKKAFLAPVLYALPLLVKIPTLLVAPWVQHFLGLVFTLMVGELVRLWTTLWKAWIIPATILATLNPAMLWYEHTLISEFLYLWFVTALLLAGTACARKPSMGRLIVFFATLLLTAGSRPEGKLYVVFCLLLVGLIRWGAWKTRLIYGGTALVFCLLVWESSRSSQAGVLLYATVLPLAPDVPKSAPGFASWIDPLRKQHLNDAFVPQQLTTAEKKISWLAGHYLKSIGDHRTTYGQFAQRLAIEAALRRPFALPVIAFNKFLCATNDPPSGDFGPLWMQRKQRVACTYKHWMVRLMPRLAGPRLADQPAVEAAMNKDKPDPNSYADMKQAVIAFVQEEYPPIGTANPLKSPDPFSVLRRGWTAITTGARVGEQQYGSHTVPGVPAFFILAVAGMLAGIVRPGPLRRLHIAWIITLAFVGGVVMLTGVMNPRYRFVFEPFCLLYIWVLADSLAALFIRRKSSDGPATT